MRRAQLSWDPWGGAQCEPCQSGLLLAHDDGWFNRGPGGVCAAAMACYQPGRPGLAHTQPSQSNQIELNAILLQRAGSSTIADSNTIRRLQPITELGCWIRLEASQRGQKVHSPSQLGGHQKLAPPRHSDPRHMLAVCRHGRWVSRGLPHNNTAHSEGQSRWPGRLLPGSAANEPTVGVTLRPAHNEIIIMIWMCTLGGRC